MGKIPRGLPNPLGIKALPTIPTHPHASHCVHNHPEINFPPPGIASGCRRGGAALACATSGALNLGGGWSACLRYVR